MKDYKKTWETLVSKSDFKNGLLKHFSFLADSKELKTILEKVIDKVTAVSIQNQNEYLEIKFQEGDQVLKCYPPNLRKNKNHPEDLQKLYAVHQQLSCGDLVIGSTQSLDFGMYEPDENVYRLFDGDVNKIQEAGFENFSNYTVWLYHPTLKNSSGKQALFPIVHELEDTVECIDNNIGSLFLERLVQLQKWEIDVPELESVKESKKVHVKEEKWWEKISYAKGLKGTLFHFADHPTFTEPLPDEILASIINLSLRDISSLEAVPFDKMPNLKELMVVNNKIPLLNVNGLEKSNSIEYLRLDNHKITDITPLTTLTSLTFLDLSDNKIKDVSCLKMCQNIEKLFLSNNPIKNIDVVSNFDKLERLRISDTRIKDIEVLSHLPKLENLYVPLSLSEEELEKFKKAKPKVSISY